MASKRESSFVQEFRKSLLFLWPSAHWTTVPDFPALTREGYHGDRGARFSVPKPYDAYAVIHGRFYAFEFKRPPPRATNFPFNALRESQRDGLAAVTHAQGSAFVVILFGEKQKRRCFCIEWSDWEAAELSPQDRKNEKSFRLDEFPRLFPDAELVRTRLVDRYDVGALVWDMQAALGLVSVEVAGIAMKGGDADGAPTAEGGAHVTAGQDPAEGVLPL